MPTQPISTQSSSSQWHRCPGCPRNRWVDQIRIDNNLPPADLWRHAISRGHHAATLRPLPAKRRQQQQYHVWIGQSDGEGLKQPCDNQFMNGYPGPTVSVAALLIAVQNEFQEALILSPEHGSCGTNLSWTAMLNCCSRAGSCVKHVVSISRN